MKKVLSIKIFIFIVLLFFIFNFKVKATDITLRIWTGSISEEKEMLEEIASEFTMQTSIKVEVFQRLEIFTVPNALVNNAQLDNRPDIVYMQAPDIGNLVKSGYLQALDFDNEFKKRFLDVGFDAFTIDNQLYGIGYNNATSGLLYNKDLISDDELPKTWEELFALAKHLTIKENNEIVQRGLYINATDMWFNYPLIREYGGYYYGKYPNGTYNAYDVGLDNQGMLEYVNKIKELKAQGLVLNNPSKTDYSDIISEFINGKVGMVFYGLWNASQFKAAGLNYGITLLPQGNNMDSSKPITTIEGFVINKYSNNLDEAKLFLNFLFQDQNQQRLIEAGNRFDKKTGERNPTNLSVINSNYIQSDLVLKNYSLIGRNTEPFPNIPEGPIWYSQNATISAFRAIFFGDSQGNEVDEKYKLEELADYIRRNVQLMNEQPSYVKVPTYIYIMFLGVFLLIICFLFYRHKKKLQQNPYSYSKKYSKKETLLAWSLMLTMIILLLAFYVYPIIHNFYLSLTDYSGINLCEFGFIGFANYRSIFIEGINGLLSMTIWTVVFAFFVITISFVFGTFVATILDKIKLKIAKIYRIIYILPWVIPTIITLLMWQGLLETEGGLINQIIGIFGIPKIPWLTHPLIARISTILVMVWFSFPYYMVIACGFLKAIPKDYYDVAKVDGACDRQIFYKITLPLIFRALIPMLIMGFIMQFNQFGVYILTQGGPVADKIGNPGATDLLITYVFNTAFNTKRYAVAASYSVIIFIFIAMFALISMKINKKRMEN